MATIIGDENRLPSAEEKIEVENDEKKLAKAMARRTRDMEEIVSAVDMPPAERVQSLHRLHVALLNQFRDVSRECAAQRRRADLATRAAEASSLEARKARLDKERVEKLCRTLNERSKASDDRCALMEARHKELSDRYKETVESFSGKINDVQEGIAAADKERADERERFAQIADKFDKQEKYWEAVHKKLEVEKQLAHAEIEQHKEIASKRDAIIEAVLAETKAKDAETDKVREQLVESQKRLIEYHELFDKTTAAIREYKQALTKTTEDLHRERREARAFARDKEAALKKCDALQRLSRALSDARATATEEERKRIEAAEAEVSEAERAEKESAELLKADEARDKEQAEKRAAEEKAKEEMEDRENAETIARIEGKTVEEEEEEEKEEEEVGAEGAAEGKGEEEAK